MTTFEARLSAALDRGLVISEGGAVGLGECEWERVRDGVGLRPIRPHPKVSVTSAVQRISEIGGRLHAITKSGSLYSFEMDPDDIKWAVDKKLITVVGKAGGAGGAGGAGAAAGGDVPGGAGKQTAQKISAVIIQTMKELGAAIDKPLNTMTSIPEYKEAILGVVRGFHGMLEAAKHLAGE